MKTIINKFFRKQIDRKVKAHVDSELRKYGFIPISETEPQDVFIVGYPKSGNTWMQFMLASLINGIDPPSLNVPIVLEFVPDVHYKKFYKRYRERCFLKTHHLPKPEYRKVIYLLRDGRDAMVSYYYMNKIQFEGYSMEQMIKEGKGLFPGRWHEHVKQWMENPYKADILIVKYEDMKSDTSHELKRICDFLSLNFSTEQISRVVEGCSFENLKKMEQTIGLNDAARQWKGDDQSRFFRKGVKGDFKNEIEPSLLKCFEEYSYEQLKRFNYL